MSKDYTNLRQLAAGCMSGMICEWPELKREAAKVVDELTTLRSKVKALEQENADLRADGLAIYATMNDGRVEKLREQLAACQREAVEWRPIETAPKDGGLFLVWDGRTYNIVWYDFNGYFKDGVGCYDIEFATHWRALPPPPKD